jgi:predicted porin
MHKTYRTTVAAAWFCLLAGFTSAQTQTTSVQLYGTLDLGVVGLHGAGQGTDYLVASGVKTTSHFGLRGSEDLGGGMRAVFTIESGFQADTGANDQALPLSGTRIPARITAGIPASIAGPLESQLGQALVAGLQQPTWNRQAFVGLVTPAGAALLGRQYTPAFQVYSRFDPNESGSVAGAYTLIAVPVGIEIRANNALQYRAEISGFVASAMTVFEHTGSGKDSFVGFNAGYRGDTAQLMVGWQSRKNTLGVKALTNTIVGGSYKWGNVRVLGSWTRLVDRAPQLGEDLRVGISAATTIPAAARPLFISAADTISGRLGFDAKLLNIGTQIDLTPMHRLVLSYGRFDDRKAQNADASIIGASYQYNFSKRTALYTAVSWVNNKSVQQVMPSGSGTLFGFTERPGQNSSGLQVSVIHQF